MAQTTSIIQTLKSVLKSRGLTYRDVSQALDLSEASIKRLFAEQNFSLQRLDQVCNFLGIEISDLVKEMESNQQRLTELTEQQENDLVADPKLLLVAFLAVNNWKYEEIISRYNLTDTETVQKLAHLDRMNLIDLLPGNRFRLRIAPNFTWRRNGPIQLFFTRHLQEDFLKSSFEDEEEFIQFPSGMLSRESCDNLNRRVRQLVQNFHTLNANDRPLPLEKKFGYSLFVAFRPWRPAVFEKLLRK